MSIALTATTRPICGDVYLHEPCARLEHNLTATSLQPHWTSIWRRSPAFPPAPSCALLHAATLPCIRTFCALHSHFFRTHTLPPPPSHFRGITTLIRNILRTFNGRAGSRPTLVIIVHFTKHRSPPHPACQQTTPPHFTVAGSPATSTWTHNEKGTFCA